MVADLSKASLPNNSDQLEVINGQGTTVCGLICHANLDLPCSTNNVVPLILRAQALKVWGKLDTAQEDIIP